MTREEAIKLLHKLRETIDRNNAYGEAEEMGIQALEQELKIGHWVRLNDYTDEKDEHKCSACGFESMGATRYCPDCGAKMFEE